MLSNLLTLIALLLGWAILSIIVALPIAWLIARTNGEWEDNDQCQ